MVNNKGKSGMGEISFGESRALVEYRVVSSRPMNIMAKQPNYAESQ